MRRTKALDGTRAVCHHDHNSGPELAQPKLSAGENSNAIKAIKAAGSRRLIGFRTIHSTEDSTAAHLARQMKVINTCQHRVATVVNVQYIPNLADGRYSRSVTKLTMQVADTDRCS